MNSLTALVETPRKRTGYFGPLTATVAVLWFFSALFIYFKADEITPKYHGLHNRLLMDGKPLPKAMSINHELWFDYYTEEPEIDKYGDPMVTFGTILTWIIAIIFFFLAGSMSVTLDEKPSWPMIFVWIFFLAVPLTMNVFKAEFVYWMATQL